LAVLAFLGCLLLVIPFGWMVGVVAAIVLSAGAVGQLPMLTIPIATLGSLAFAVLPIFPVGTRLVVMGAGSVGLWLFAVAAMRLAGHL
jgi:hypothetical protein